MAVKEPFPAQQLAILAICRLAECIAFASIISYNYPYVKDIRGTPENSAFYAGLLVSAFALAEASTAVLWGMISDKYGRKPLVLSGLLGVALSSLIFGLAKTYWVAFAARAIGGGLNGNVSVMQTMVAEMVKCPEHEPFAYSMIPFMLFFGSMVGSSMGALLARPALLWPALKGSIFDKHPYFLPNLVVVILILFAVTLGMLFLKETRATTPGEKETPESHGDERSPLLRSNQPKQQIDSHVSGTAPTLSHSQGVAASSAEATLIANAASGSISEGLSAGQGQKRVAAKEPSHGWNRNMVFLILQLALVSYLQMVYGVIMPIYLVDSPSPTIPEGHYDPLGGFGFTVRQVGGIMSVNGLIAIIVQGVMFTPFVRRFGVWKSFIGLTMLAPLSYVIVPFITMVPRAHALAAIYGDLFIQNFMNIIVYPCLLILLKDSTPSVSILGQVNGMAMMCCSGARTIAPPLVGYIYGSSGSAAGWWSITLVALIAALLIPTIKRPTPAKGTQDDGSDEEAHRVV